MVNIHLLKIQKILSVHWSFSSKPSRIEDFSQKMVKFYFYGVKIDLVFTYEIKFLIFKYSLQQNYPSDLSYFIFVSLGILIA